MKIIVEVVYLSGRQDRLYGAASNQVAGEIEQTVERCGYPDTRISFQGFWVNGQHYHTYAFNTDNVERVSLILPDPPTGVDKPSHSK